MEIRGEKSSLATARTMPILPSTILREPNARFYKTVERLIYSILANFKFMRKIQILRTLVIYNFGTKNGDRTEKERRSI